MICAVLWGIWRFGVEAWVIDHNFPAIVPGRVNIVAINLDAGYKILVSNQIATVVQAGGDKFEASSSNLGIGGNGPDQKLKPLPIRSMLGAMTGNADEVSQFIMDLNGLSPNESWPIRRIVWKAEDIEKALGGDPVLLPKLVTALDVNLDGSPVTALNLVGFENGIVVDVPCPIQIQAGDTLKTVQARLQFPFMPELVKSALQDFNDHGSPTIDQRSIYYSKWAEKTRNGSGSKQDIRGALEALISPDTTRPFAQKAKDLLNAATIVISDSQVRKAEEGEEDLNGKPMYTLNLDVTNNGRLRLWKYSIEHPNAQLLLMSDGIAIAAPKISHELMTEQISVTQMQDEQLVQDAISNINKAKGVS